MKESLKCKCGETFKPIYRNGILFSKLCPACLAAKTVKKLKQNQKKKAVSEKKAWNIEKKAIKKELKTHSDWQNDLQKEINKLVRLIDYGQCCVASRSINGKMNAGHFYSVGGNNSIRFNLHNIFLQSEHSNQFKGGDEHRYREGVLLDFGSDYLQFMYDLKKDYPLIKLTKSELEQKISIVRALTKLHQPQQMSNKDRLIYRNKYNRAIGIYDKSFDIDLLH